MNYNIQGLINEDGLKECIDNITDAYDKAVVQVAINVMEHLDNFEGEFNIGHEPDMTTPSGIINKCDGQGRIDDFMAGWVLGIITSHHKIGWKFWLAARIRECEVGNKERLAELVSLVADAPHILVDEEEAQAYVPALVARFNAKED